MLARLFGRNPAPPRTEPLAEALAAIMAATWHFRPGRQLDGPETRFAARVAGLGSVWLDQDDFAARAAERWPGLRAEELAALRALLDAQGALAWRLNAVEGAGQPQDRLRRWAER